MDKDTKSKLIEAAIPLFPQKGYAGVSIREIADAAGVNSASISYYFGGKEGLYEAVLESIFSQIDVIVDSDANGSSPMTRYRQLTGQKYEVPYDIRIRPWYNQDFVSAYYMVPGIMDFTLSRVYSLLEFS